MSAVAGGESGRRVGREIFFGRLVVFRLVSVRAKLSYSTNLLQRVLLAKEPNPGSRQVVSGINNQ